MLLGSVKEFLKFSHGSPKLVSTAEALGYLRNITELGERRDFQ